MILYWFRRDLRLNDNHGLYRALDSGKVVIPVFIYDRDIVDPLQDRDDARVTFIYDHLEKLKFQLEEAGSSLLIKYGNPQALILQIAKDFNVETVIANHDYEPAAIDRDKEIEQRLYDHGIGFHTYKDQVIFEKDEITKADGKPYTVFTPYSKKWKATLGTIPEYPSASLMQNFLPMEPVPAPTIKSLGFIRSNIKVPILQLNDALIRRYHQQRDFPAVEGTSRIGVHLRFGSVSIRKVVKFALDTNQVFLNELIWREFFMMILWHFPKVVTAAFKSKYDHIPWRNNENEFKAWCEGQTGYPIVDAGMRELKTTGFMHNRVRMITAGFLTKHLLIDWRWGEAWFARFLLDYELASNNGNWQWAAGSGCDAAPYFRIFNPSSQTQKFDAQQHYIKKWVPEFNNPSYPHPMVDHAFARTRAIETYKSGLNSG